jgi:hypothetical protein
MANELQATAQLSYTKDNARMAVQATVSITVAGTKYCDVVQNIGTAREDIVFGDIGTPGYFMVQNLDATNYVELSSDAGSTYSIKLTPAASATVGGGAAMVANNGATWSARANTAACNISVQAVAP